MDYKKLKTCLCEEVKQCSNVIIVAHNRLDIDAISSALGLYEIVDSMDKEVCIATDDNYESMEAGVKRIIDEVGLFINITNSANLNITENTLLITTDVNKNNRICLKEDLFNKKIVIDHHKIDENTINTPYLFVDEKISSTCEIIGHLLALYDIELTHKKLYSYIYAGIVLDTRNFTKDNITAETLKVGSFLISHGAQIMISNSLFVQKFDDDRRFQKIVSQANFKEYKIALAMDKENPLNIYNCEDMAKAANYLLQFENDATFALGMVQSDLVYISARSTGDIDVEKIMKEYGGGGNFHSAASQIMTNDIIGVYEDLNDRLRLDRSYSLKPYK